MMHSAYNTVGGCKQGAGKTAASMARCVEGAEVAFTLVFCNLSLGHFPNIFVNGGAENRHTNKSPPFPLPSKGQGTRKRREQSWFCWAQQSICCGMGADALDNNKSQAGQCP